MNSSVKGGNLREMLVEMTGKYSYMRRLMINGLASAFLALATSAAGECPMSTGPNSGEEPLPLLVLQTTEHPMQDRTRVPASLCVLLPKPADSGFESDYAGLAEVSVRGNSSYQYDKKSYRLELQNANGRDRRIGLLGLPADSDWVLYAAVTDRTFVRNTLAHELWRAMGRYAIRGRLVELFVLTNGHRGDLNPENLIRALPVTMRRLSATNFLAERSTSGDITTERLEKGYVGLYVLLEKIKLGQGRLDLSRLRRSHETEPDITGGYIIKKDDVGRNERVLVTGQEYPLRFEEPQERELTTLQRRWMEGYLDRFEKTLMSRDYRDPKRGYAHYLDIESFVDFHWLVEVSKNADGYWFSQYMHKERAGKLTMGPLWDWDRTFGTPFFGAVPTNGWRFESATDPDYTWYRRLFDDPDFLQRYVDRWAELRTNVLATPNVWRLIDQLASGLGAAHVRNGIRWERGPNAPSRVQAGVSHAAEVAELKLWLRDRLSWIDSQDFPRPVVHVSPAGDDGRVRVSMAGLNGRIYYTMDGSDPRSHGGERAPTAVEYRGIVETTNRVVTARIRSNFGLWSAPVTVSLVAPSVARSPSD